jgi:hypothetical protein
MCSQHGGGCRHKCSHIAAPSTYSGHKGASNATKPISTTSTTRTSARHTAPPQMKRSNAVSSAHRCFPTSHHCHHHITTSDLSALTELLKPQSSRAAFCHPIGADGPTGTEWKGKAGGGRTYDTASAMLCMHQRSAFCAAAAASACSLRTMQ